MPVVSVSMPDELLEQLDAHAAKHEQTSRSELLREGTRSLLAEFEDDRLGGAVLAATVSVLYDFGTPSVERRVTELRHEFNDVVVANDHSHVGDYCLDLLVLETDLDDVSSFVGKLRAIDGVGNVEYTLVPVENVERVPDT
jgi:CopG family transcriptional regulator, nickel-responsive regulator